ncbi:hypothetical protein ABT160_43325 [Streptomyces sp. NPDC001941]|uniref:hypothetical protein n=1 Tax=Streptomyces sp. NPDC001941 TaxID=3154659 RepID=UPI00331AFE3B
MSRVSRALLLPALLALPLLATAAPAAVAASPATTASAPGPCRGVPVPAGYRCVPEPKQCFTTPCPQYRLEPVGPRCDHRHDRDEDGHGREPGRTTLL